METIVPKCIKNNACFIVCNYKTCNASPFLCADEQCSCHSIHQKCITSMKWKGIRQLFSNKLKKSSTQLDTYFRQIDDIYKKISKQLEKSASHIKDLYDNFGLSQLEREVYQKLKQKKFTELTSELINKVEVDLMENKKQFQIKNIEKEKKQIQKQATILVQMLQGLTKLSMIKGEQIKLNSPIKPIKQSITSFKLDSKITQDVGILSSFFPKKIVNMNLLYRASENNFQVSKFHEKCDDKQHTITILKTQFGNVIGGYTPLPWKSIPNDKWQWGTDNSMQSFIFSLTNKHKLTLIQGKQDKAIYHHSNYGPRFGGGNDIGIQDKVNQNNGWARPGNAYNYNNEYVFGTQQSYKKFSGQSSGQCFKILQWQVYAIVFA